MERVFGAEVSQTSYISSMSNRILLSAMSLENVYHLISPLSWDGNGGGIVDDKSTASIGDAGDAGNIRPNLFRLRARSWSCFPLREIA